MKKIIILLFIIAFSFGITKAQLQNFSVGQTAPDFTITDSRGNVHTLYQYTNDGKYVLIDFFAYWCGPCISTAPIIDQFYKKYGCNSGNVAVLGVEADGNITQLHEFDEQAGIDSLNSYPAATGLEGNGDTVDKIFNPYAYPTIVLIGTDKKFINIDIWPISTMADIEAVFPNGSITPLSCATGIEEIQSGNTINISPNPVKDILTVSLKKNSSEIQYEIFNVSGQIIAKNILSGNDKIEINVSVLPAGFYTLKTASSKGFGVSKFIIAR